jgi:hypothetical protein
LALALTGCGLAATALDGGSCPQVEGEFGSAGCARVVAVVEGSDKGWPSPHWLSVQARWPSGELIATASEPSFGANPLLLLQRLTAARLSAGDTASVVIMATVYAGNPLDGSDPEVQAADSVLHVAVFSAIGDHHPPDKVWLTLR